MKLEEIREYGELTQLDFISVIKAIYKARLGVNDIQLLAENYCDYMPEVEKQGGHIE